MKPIRKENQGEKPASDETLGEAMEALFPLEADKAELRILRKELTEGFAANESPDEIWRRIKPLEGTALGLIYALVKMWPPGPIESPLGGAGSKPKEPSEPKERKERKGEKEPEKGRGIGR